MSDHELKLTSSNFDMYHNNKLYEHKHNWISISNGYIYISKGDMGRWYSILHRMKPKDRPYLYFDDDEKTLYYKHFKFVIKKSQDYNIAKKYLQSYETKNVQP
jgi:hypothetical protein